MASSVSVMEESAAVVAEEVEQLVRCFCCSRLADPEEWTPGDIARVREKYQGRFICGYSESVIEYTMKKENITVDKAIWRHQLDCDNFRSKEVKKVEDLLIPTLKQRLLRTLSSRRRTGSGSDHEASDHHLLRSKSSVATVRRREGSGYVSMSEILGDFTGSRLI